MTACVSIAHSSTPHVAHDARAVSALYAAYGETLRVRAARLLKNEADAEDAVHDAFIALLLRPLPPKGRALTYLSAIVRRVCRDQLRELRARAALTEP